MPYRIKGTLKLPATSQSAAGVEIEFISRRNYSPLLTDLSSIIKTSPTGAYDVTLEYGEYAVVLYWGCNQPSHIGKLFVFADTVAGLDLQTLLQQADWQPATPEYIQQIQGWLADSLAAANQATESAAAAKASELAAEADRAEVASNKTIVVNAQTDVTNKRNDVTTKAAQVATNTATVNEKTPLAVAAANTATEKAASASTDAATASDAARRAETAAQAMTGAVLDGGQCNLSSGFYPPALTVGGKKYSTVWYVQVGGTVSGITYDAGDVLRYTTANNAYFKIDAVDTATAQINAHAAKVGAHPISGVEGLEAALADKADASSVFEAAPLPDVWIPFNDSLRMIAGFGRDVKVGGDAVATLAGFERATTATLINKSNSLQLVTINEPRFEAQGLLTEGQSTNLVARSEGATFQAGNSSFQTITNNVSGVLPVAGQRIIFAASNGETNAGLIQAAITLNGGGYYTYSLFLKVEDGEDSDLINCLAAYSSSSAGVTNKAVIQDFGDGVKRLSCNISVGGTGGQTVYIRAQRRGVWDTTTWTAVIGGVQVEEFTSASSYIPTNGAAVTRAADAVKIPRINNECAEWYSGSDKITPKINANTIEFLPPAGKRHIRNLKGFFTPLTEAQKKGLK